MCLRLSARLSAGGINRGVTKRPTLPRIYEELRNRGYGGGYGAVRRHAASWSKATQEASASAYLPLSFDPGAADQSDWRHLGTKGATLGADGGRI